MITSSAERRRMRNSGGTRSCGSSWQTAHFCLYSSAPSGEVAACCCEADSPAETMLLSERKYAVGKANAETKTEANKLRTRILLGAFIESPDRKLSVPQSPSKSQRA